MTGNIILNQNNLTPTGYFDARTTAAPYNKLLMNMRGMQLSGRMIGLKKANLYYSWPNIVGTTSITIQWPVAGSFTNFTWTLPALTNYESVEVLNDSLQAFCIANGLYLINGTGSSAVNIYYVELAANSVNYKVTLNLFKVPISAGSYTAPSNWPGYPTTSVTPKILVPSGSELGKLIGFDDNTTYNGNTSAVQFSSVYVPQLSPISTVFITLNCAKNDVPINGSTVIATFTTHGVSYGSMIIVEPSETDYYEVDSNTNVLEIQFWDQNWNKLYIQDPQITVQLLVR